MFKLNNLGLSLILLGLALVVSQNRAADDHQENHESNEEAFNKELDSMFEGHDDLKESISKYLDRVPISHKTHKHAQRCLLSGLFNFQKHSKTTTTTTTTTSPNTNRTNAIKAVIGAIFKNGDKHRTEGEEEMCKPEHCQACPRVAYGCIPCPKVDCQAEKCAPCPLPDYCRPPMENEKCPPEPVCEVCFSGIVSTEGFNSTSSISQKTSTTYYNKPLSAKTSRKPKTTGKPSNETGHDEPPPEILNLLKLLMMNEDQQSQTTTTTTETSSTSTTTSKPHTTNGSSQAPKGHKTRKPKRSTTTSKRPHKSTTTRKGYNNTTTRRGYDGATTRRGYNGTTTRRGYGPSTSTTKRHSTTSITPTNAPITSSTTSTTPAASTTSTGSPIIKMSGDLTGGLLLDGKVKIEGKQTSTTSTNATTTVTQDGHISTNKTTTSTSTTGTFLFEKNIKIMVSNATIRAYIMKMIEGIPENTGGEEMKLAEKLLAHFGEKKQHLDKSKRKGSNRSFTYMKARGNVKGILGHLLDRYRRKKCECKPCAIVKTCPDCPKQEACPPRKPNYKCSACPKQDITCPAPKGCPSYPACKSCPKSKDDPDDDGKLEDLDDVDTKDTVKDGELMKDQECAKDGLTCPFEKTCGRAYKNPLTPKSNKQGYMNGGEDEIYGEWPHFVSLRITTDTGSGICGGVLITDRHIMTASHCVYTPDGNGGVGKRLEPTAFKVILGEHDKNKKDEHEEEHQISEVCASKKFFHDNDHGSIYDFAVLTMDKNVTLNDYIQPVCMPYKALELNKKSRCYVVGLGATKMTMQHNDIKVDFSNVVQKMRVERASCKGWGIKHDDRSRHCFTKANAKGDTCGGDSGGPVVCLSKQNRWTLMGLVSYGSELCDGSESIGWVAVYARVQALLKTMNAECKI